VEGGGDVNSKGKVSICITYINKEIIIESNEPIKKKENEKNTILYGLDDKFPIENFVNLKSTQKGKDIYLQTYKYPSKLDGTKGVVYLL
jgi:hypothetical protein